MPKSKHFAILRKFSKTKTAILRKNGKIKTAILRKDLQRLILFVRFCLYDDVFVMQFLCYAVKNINLHRKFAAEIVFLHRINE